MSKKLDSMVLILSDSHGQYIPQIAMEELTAQWQGILDADKQALLAGPNHEWYWEAWENVLNSAFFMDGDAKYTLWQDGGLWAICLDRMTNEEHSNFFGEIKPAPEDSYEYAVCQNCLIALANDDYSGMDDHEEIATRDGLALLHKEYKQVIPDGAEYGFKNSRCDCCDALPGDRLRVICFK